MLKIRLQRVGRKHEPAFRLVLTDSKNSTKSGKVAEILGSYDPRKVNEVLKTDRIKHWISKGVGLTDTVNNLLIKKGVIRGKKVHVGADYKAPEVKPEETPLVEAQADASMAEATAEAPTETPAATEPEASPSTTEEAPAEASSEEKPAGQ